MWMSGVGFATGRLEASGWACISAYWPTTNLDQAYRQVIKLVFTFEILVTRAAT